MHLLSTQPGGFVDDDAAGIVRIEQTPADIVILSATDTTLALLASAYERLPADFPSVRLCNLLNLRQHASVDLYIDEVVQHARVVIVDHLGGESYWPYGTEQLVTQARDREQILLMFSGDLTEDLNLLHKSTAAIDQTRQLWRYLRESGPDNAIQFFHFLGQHFFKQPTLALPPKPLPEIVIYDPVLGLGTSADWQRRWTPAAPVVAIVFYRAHLQAGNTAVFDALIQELEGRHLNPLPIALSSLKEPLCLETLQQLCRQHAVALVLNTTAFSLANINAPQMRPLAGSAPVLQVILSGGNREAWESDHQGLNPRDIAMQVALPEVDGRIITRAISFKGHAYRSQRTQLDVVQYQADPERIAFVGELTARWCRLQTLPNASKRIGLILANYPTRDGRIGNGVGLDTPASVVEILQLLQRQGYALEAFPGDGDSLLQALLQGVTNDPELRDLRPAKQSFALAEYLRHFALLPPQNQQAVRERWGEPALDPMLRQERFMIAGIRSGNVFIGIQPARGYELDPYATYHSADLAPPHYYLAYYFWLRHTFACDALVHVGKHGNLEWLPGKSVALSNACWPDILLGPLPHLYPFIVNDPGEGSQAKRRAQAVIIDHLMPPLTRAENYGALQNLERQVDEYYEALLVDRRRAKVLRQTIIEAIVQFNLHRDLGFDTPQDSTQEDALLTRTDAYLCEVKESQIRDGLHIFGRSPKARQRLDTLMALARFPVDDGRAANAGLLGAICCDLQLGAFDPLAADWAQPWDGPRPQQLLQQSSEPWRHGGDTRERLEQLATALIDGTQSAAALPQTQQVLARITNLVAPALDACGFEELKSLGDGLNGLFVAPGPSGAPSRGRPDVLPTGRNFYSVDTRAVPTPTAWRLGVKSAYLLVERYLQEHGEYPRAIGLSVWGTATMRTGGDDIAQAFALIGVRPKWAAGSFRVTDFEILPMSILERPRIDVTLRVSGFFRDAFANVMHLFDAAVQKLAQLDEPADVNPIRARIIADSANLVAQGLSNEAAREQAGWRIFGSKPGSYGAGLQGLMDTGNWDDDKDLASVYRDWGGYAYGSRQFGASAPERFGERLATIDLVVQNQDNREHDLLDSNDYYQFQGGMTAAVRHFSGQQPAIYHGDHSNPQAPRIHSLQEEISRVIRARVINPKWLSGIKRHGYKGAFEIAATVDYLFGYDATARVIGDYQYALVTDAYVNDSDTREFLQQHNPAAFQDICERLLEAIQRGLWQEPGDNRRQLEEHLLHSELQREQKQA